MDTVLVANRGEIAVRVIDACHRLGLRAVAVYSDPDRDAPHVSRADVALRIGPAPARDSYMNIPALLQAAERAGAGAVHPGYGFLAEHAGFSRACTDAGLVFIGPHAQAIEAMGAKSTAKAFAQEAGVPTVPGYHGAAQDDDTLMAEAGRIGWPLLIKASAGGGGRGMRRVETPDQLREALDLARAEADAAFGDPTLLLERFVPRARHLEVQVLGDRHGHLVHLFERDCSLQRNHQKLVEEAPAPDLAEGLRRNLHHWATELARAIDYDNAGTVEFVHDPASGEAWFLEMNTRLQVEHPVTEMITGIDLAAWQIRIAGGEALDFGQDDIRVDGWAMEARVAAEDPANDYAPRTGTLSHWRVPELPGLRVDAGVRAGNQVAHHYDSLLAKLIAHGRDRDESRRRLRRALGALEAAGVTLNTGFLSDLLELPDFAAGRPHTALIEETWPQGWRAPTASRRHMVEAVLAKHVLSTETASTAGAWGALGAWRITEPAGRPGAAIHYVRLTDGTTLRARVKGRQGRLAVEIEEDDPIDVTGVAMDDGRLCYEANGCRHDVGVLIDAGHVTLFQPDSTISLEVLAPEHALLGVTASTASEGAVVAPMPGSVVEVRVEPGQAVRAGDTLCVLEAMKLFQELSAPFDGVVAELRVKPGQSVAGEALVALVTPAESSAESTAETIP